MPRNLKIVPSASAWKINIQNIYTFLASEVFYDQNEPYQKKSRRPVASAYPVYTQNWVSDANAMYVSRSL